MPKVIAEYKELVKSRILKAALDSFTTSGYHETTMEDIAKIVGISKSSIYNYFSSKEELYQGIAGEARVRMRNAFNSISQNFGEEFKDLITNMPLDFRYKYPLYLEVLLEGRKNEKLSNVLSEDFLEEINALSSLLKEQIDKGIIAKDYDPNSLAVLIYLTYSGSLLSLFMGIEKKYIAKGWNNLVKFILKQ